MGVGLAYSSRVPLTLHCVHAPMNGYLDTGLFAALLLGILVWTLRSCGLMAEQETSCHLCNSVSNCTHNRSVDCMEPVQRMGETKSHVRLCSEGRG